MNSTNFSIIFRHETKIILFSVNFKHCDLRRFVDQHCFFFLQLKSQKCFHFFADNKQKSSEEEKDENHVKNICFLCIEKRSLYFDGFIGLRNIPTWGMMQNRESLVNLCQIILRVVLLGRKFFSMWGMMLFSLFRIRRIFLHILKSEF